jgi:uncharacterized membrane-anchored protein
MSRKDTFHYIVRRALEKDGWTITHDQLLLRYELGNLYIDLGAEKVFAAEREGQKIATTPNKRLLTNGSTRSLP